jgi:hypothetical protein
MCSMRIDHHVLISIFLLVYRLVKFHSCGPLEFALTQSSEYAAGLQIDSAGPISLTAVECM